MYDIFTYIWLICMVNVGKYTIHPWILRGTIPNPLATQPQPTNPPISQFNQGMAGRWLALLAGAWLWPWRNGAVHSCCVARCVPTNTRMVEHWIKNRVVLGYIAGIILPNYVGNINWLVATQICFNFTPKIGEDEPNFDSYFSDGLKPPTR